MGGRQDPADLTGQDPTARSCCRSPPTATTPSSSPTTRSPRGPEPEAKIYDAREDGGCFAFPPPALQGLRRVPRPGRAAAPPSTDPTPARRPASAVAARSKVERQEQPARSAAAGRARSGGRGIASSARSAAQEASQEATPHGKRAIEGKQENQMRQRQRRPRRSTVGRALRPSPRRLVAAPVGGRRGPRRRTGADRIVRHHQVTGSSKNATQAGGHPDLPDGFTLANRVEQAAKNVTFNAPEGLFGNPNAITQCTSADFASVSAPRDPGRADHGLRELRRQPNLTAGHGAALRPRAGDETALFGFIVPDAEHPDPDPGLGAHGDGLRAALHGLRHHPAHAAGRRPDSRSGASRPTPTHDSERSPKAPGQTGRVPA